MVPVRFVQTGDLHLLANPSWQEAGRNERNRRLQAALSLICEKAQAADFLLLAGDIVDGKDWCPATLDERLAWFVKLLKAVGSQRVVCAFGSHDHESVRNGSCVII